MRNASPPSRAAVEAELARLCESERLRRAPVHARLLRYVVERAIARDRGGLTETAIAVAVFRRDPAAYDPHVDPIVRVAMSRLRARLAACYADAPGTRGVSIVVPKGEYVPRFVATSVQAARASVEIAAVRNATGETALDRTCAGFAPTLRRSLAAAGTRVASSRSTSTALRLDPVLSRDPDGHLRWTVRGVDPVDGTVRWSETASGRVPGRLARGIAARVAARCGRR